ncbi:PspA/IM30 family protein [Planctomicrobium sp. SH661]|uniref:PspA/IM30 family protein n=1 Tax=Planctomicrobium sp. SH661 TaxID=3448124 RepID=UPI003F5B347D
MAYFSRLTDIVTCNLSSLLARNQNCVKFLEGIIHEMQEGVAGAQRCVGTAIANVTRLESEIGEQRLAVRDWINRAQTALRRNDESQARLALERKHEVEDLIAGLEQQLQAAMATRDHLGTMLSALQARLADALRRLEELRSGEAENGSTQTSEVVSKVKVCEVHRSRVDSELEELRKQMQLD